MGARFVVSLFVAMFVAVGCAKNEEDKFRLPDEVLSEVDQEPISEEAIERGRWVQKLGWIEPNYTEAEADQIMLLYSYVDKHGLVPKNLLKKAILFYHRNYDLLGNKDLLAVVDFSKHSRKDRFYIVNMRSAIYTGDVSAFHVSHGKGSDPSHSGYASKFSNDKGSEMSSLGFYLAGETYVGKHGYPAVLMDCHRQILWFASERSLFTARSTFLTRIFAKGGRMGVWRFQWPAESMSSTHWWKVP